MTRLRVVTQFPDVRPISAAVSTAGYRRLRIAGGDPAPYDDRMRAARLVIAILVVLLVTGVANAQPPRPGVFTGPEIWNIFKVIRLPEYPYEARRSSWSGRGTFRAHVTADGKVTRVEVVKSTGHRAVDEAVLTAARSWRAHPGRKMEVDFPIAFVAPARPPSGLPQ